MSNICYGVRMGRGFDREVYELDFKDYTVTIGVANQRTALVKEGTIIEYTVTSKRANASK